MKPSYRKWMAAILAAGCFFSMSESKTYATGMTTVVETQTADITAPVIDATSIKVTPAAGAGGTVVHYEVKVTDDRVVSAVGINLRSEVGNVPKYLLMNHISGDIWGVDCTMEASAPSGKWRIAEIYAQDSGQYNTAGANQSRLINTVLTSQPNQPNPNNQYLDLSAYDFTLTGTTTGDTTPPVIDPASLTITPKAGTNGTELTISFRADDPESSLSYGYINYFALRPDNKQDPKGTSLRPDPNNPGFFVGTIKIDDTFLNTTYMVHNIMATSNTAVPAISRVFNQNNLAKNFINVSDPYESLGNLDGGNFTVSGNAVEFDPPVLDPSSFKVVDNSIKSGETVIMQIKASDANAFEICVSLVPPVTSTQTMYQWLTDPDGDGLFTLEIPTDENTENGLWTVESLEAYDKFNNTIGYYTWDAEDKAILDQGQFYVSYNGDIAPTTTTAATTTTEPSTTSQETTSLASTTTTAVETTTTTPALSSTGTDPVNGTTTTVPVTNSTTAVSTTPSSTTTAPTVTPSQKPLPYLISGSGYKITQAQELTFEIASDFGALQSVQVDGVTLTTSQYRTYSGSTWIALNSSYVATLAAGTHTLSTAFNASANFAAGNVEVTFEILPVQTSTTASAANTSGNPSATTAKPDVTTAKAGATSLTKTADLVKTGESGQVLLLAAALVLIGSAAILFVLRRKTKDE